MYQHASAMGVLNFHALIMDLSIYLSRFSFEKGFALKYPVKLRRWECKFFKLAAVGQVFIPP